MQAPSPSDTSKCNGDDKAVSGGHNSACCLSPIRCMDDIQEKGEELIFTPFSYWHAAGAFHQQLSGVAAQLQPSSSTLEMGTCCEEAQRAPGLGAAHPTWEMSILTALRPCSWPAREGKMGLTSPRKKPSGALCMPPQHPLYQLGTSQLSPTSLDICRAMQTCSRLGFTSEDHCPEEEGKLLLLKLQTNNSKKHWR